MTIKKALRRLQGRMGWTSALEEPAKELCMGTCCSPSTTFGTTMEAVDDEKGFGGKMDDGSSPVDTLNGTTIDGGTTKTEVTRHGVKSDSIDAVPTQYRDGVSSIPHDDREVSEKNILNYASTWKISSKAAVVGAMLLMPLQGMFSQMSGAADFCEIACAPTSRLSAEMESMGYEIKRINFKEGYDLETRSGTRLLDLHLRSHPPRSTWVSMPCTRLSALQNLTERSPEEWAKFEQRQGRDLKRADEVAEAVGNSLVARPDSDIAWEWPTSAHKGWKSRAIRTLLRKIKEAGRTPYWCHFHGCAYGLTFGDMPVQKSWTVLTTNRQLWLSLQRKCPGHVEHVHCRGEVAKASSYYPLAMVKAVAKALSTSWSKAEDDQQLSLAADVEAFLLDIPGRKEEALVDQELVDVREESPEIFALTRTRYPKEAPTGRRLEQIKQSMMRVHRSAGHPSFANLQRLLRVRKAPQWAIDLAGSLICPECVESTRPMPNPPASLKPAPSLFEIVGVDVFEFDKEDQLQPEEVKTKHKLLLWRDRASGYAYVEYLAEYSKAWEPKTSDILKSLSNWLMVNPSPEWIISDAGTVFTSEEFLDFAGRSGIGVMTAPAEAHWMMGAEEGCIRILKQAVRRLLREEPGLPIREAFALAVHGHNNTIGSNGFSPFQWVRGGACPQDDLPVGLDPRKAFGGLLRLKEKARIAYEQENAKDKLSKLNNATVRRLAEYPAGSLVMLWRQRMRPGKTSGHWCGPVRVLHQEGRSTLWLASGSSLVKAKINQVRPCSKREELQTILQGVSIYKTPVTMSTLLKEFTGKHYTDVTGENPSPKMLQEDTTAADVVLESRPAKVAKVIPPQGVKRKEVTPSDADDENEDEMNLEGQEDGGAPIPPTPLPGRADRLLF